MPTAALTAYRLAYVGVVLACSVAAAAPATRPAGLFVRVTLTSPTDRTWRVHVIAQRPGGNPKGVFAGKTVAASADVVGFLPAGQTSAWVDLSDARSPGGETVRFLFETQPALEKSGEHAGVAARIDVATAADDAAVVRSVTDHDPGNVISVRVPPEPANDPKHVLSIREDSIRRLEEIKSFGLPDEPRPKKIWCMTGFRSNGEFYTDPAIAEIDFEIVRRLGMNGYWEQNGGQPGDLRKMAHAAGLDRSTVYWRSIESPPGDPALGGATHLDWPKLDAFLDTVYRDTIAGTRARHPAGMPEVIADLMDEPAGLRFDGPEYREAFRAYLRQQRLTPELFGKHAWDDVSPILLDWRGFFARCAQPDVQDEPGRRLFYWSAKFWNHAVASAYALATSKVERYAPGVATRVNFGPPWVYDYGTLARGIDAFEFGRLRGVTLGFNEDWVGAGSPRVPLEANTLLIDWSRAAARPNTPPLGAYITRDADRATVKLRTFACLAREAKIFDFYYYGPAYTFFDHWSDNASVVRGVAELTRDLGSVDEQLWAGRAPRAEIALLYSQSWPVWKADDTEQCEQMMAYVALLHAGLPVDIVSDTEVADGRFAARQYRALYVVNESIPTAAAAEVERWVSAGGHLWAAGWAGMRDEYNSPTNAWDAMLGVTSRTWKPVGDQKRIGVPIKVDDWKRPIFARDVSLTVSDSAATQPAEGAATETAGAAAARHPSAYRRAHGRGAVQVVPWAAGKAYMDAATERPGSLAKATLFPNDEHRRVFADFALAAGAAPPDTTSVNQVLAWPLWSQGRGVVLLANYTGEPVPDTLRVSFTAPAGVTTAHSLHHGDLPVKRPDPQHLEVTLPMNDVTDIVVVD